MQLKLIHFSPCCLRGRAACNVNKRFESAVTSPGERSEISKVSGWAWREAPTETWPINFLNSFSKPLRSSCNKPPPTHLRFVNHFHSGFVAARKMWHDRRQFPSGAVVCTRWSSEIYLSPLANLQANGAWGRCRWDIFNLLSIWDQNCTVPV